MKKSLEKYEFNFNAHFYVNFNERNTSIYAYVVKKFK